MPRLSQENNVLLANDLGLNREAWLNELCSSMLPIFSKFEVSKKLIKVTCGWPSSGGLSRRQTIGQCFSSEVSTGGVFELFISPVLDAPLHVAGVLAHEVAHVAAGTKAGHGKWFKTVCKSVGLTNGKATSVLPGDRLNEKLSKLIEKLGDYPHRKIDPSKSSIKKEKKPSSRTTLECECGCKIQISNKWLENGRPTCVCGTPF